MALISPAITLRSHVQAADVAAIRAIVTATNMFRPNEIEVAEELVSERLLQGDKSGYFFQLAEFQGEVVGYVCYGPIEVTLHSYDLYWIVVHPAHQGKKIGTQLLQAALQSIALQGGKQLYIETSGRDDYASTRRFYDQAGCQLEAIIRNFYAPQDDKYIYVLRLT